MKIRFLSLFVAIIFLLALFTSGCKRQDNELSEEMPIVLVVLTGNHANSQNFDIQLNSVAQKVYSSFGNIGIIVVDGNPTLLYNEDTKGIAGCYSIEILMESQKVYNLNDTTWKRQYLTPQIDSFQEVFEASIADDPEVDTLKALQIAVEALNTIEASMGTEVKKEILVLDTGLCTSGALSFLQPNCLALLMNEKKLWEDEEKIKEVSFLINSLDDAAEIPNLFDITITWYGLGKTDYPQPNLTNLNVQNLQYLWGEILKKSGVTPSCAPGADGKYGIFVATSASASITSKQLVTPIINWTVPTEENTPKLTEEMLGFEPNLSSFRSETQVNEILLPYASNLMNYPDMEILLVGTTSSWNGGSVALSVERAEKVKEKLVEFGVSGDRIHIIGLGYNLDFCQNDTPDGIFVETIAKENRAVFILPYSSEKAQITLENLNDTQS